MHIKKTKGSLAISGFMAVLLSVLIATMGLPFAATSASAAPTDDLRGAITVTRVQDGDEFSAVRIIDTIVANNGAMSHRFADGFSYGDNADVRTDKGLNAYSTLTDDVAKQDAASEFAKQVTADSERYEAVASGDAALFENLPLGTYLIQCTKPNGTHSYQYMVDSVLPTFDGTAWVFEGPTIVNAKSIKGSETTHELTKQVEPTMLPADVGERIATYNVVVTPTGDNVLSNLRVVDALDEDAIAAGYVLNQDVVVTSGNDGSIVETATISYQTMSDKTVGYTIDIPSFPQDDTLNITYTADAQDVISAMTLNNLVYAEADNSPRVDAQASVELASEYMEEADTPFAIPPLEQIVDDIVAMTGDATPWIFGGIGIAIALIIVLIVRRKKRDK